MVICYRLLPNTSSCCNHRLAVTFAPTHQDKLLLLTNVLNTRMNHAESRISSTAAATSVTTVQDCNTCICSLQQRRHQYRQRQHFIRASRVNFERHCPSPACYSGR